MSDRLLSVGVDVGTTSTQLVVSQLVVENRATGFAVPELEITDRKILYRSPIYFTPLLEGNLVDGMKLRGIVEKEYQKAGITRAEVDTGAIIVTGETSRRENAQTVLEALSEYAGDFVVAAAGPDLESVLAAKGSGAVEHSAQTGKTVMHMDIGGGTSNLSLIRDGQILRTGCLNVGGRLVKFSESGAVIYLSEVLAGLTDMRLGEIPTKEQRQALAEKLTEALEMAAGRRESGQLLHRLMTREAARDWDPPEEAVVVSFSGGVADCIAKDHPVLAFGDLGPELGQAIRKSALCTGEHILGAETIRATVIGAGCYSTQLSGSTVYYQNVRFPLKNLPVVRVPDLSGLKETMAQQEGPVIFSLHGIGASGYRELCHLAENIAAQASVPIYLCMEPDMAKALGQALAVRLPPQAQILCIDAVRVDAGSYLDIGAPVGGALPVVVKTLVLSK